MAVWPGGRVAGWPGGRGAGPWPGWPATKKGYCDHGTELFWAISVGFSIIK